MMTALPALLLRGRRRPTLSIVSGPAGDPRSADRVRGFLSVAPATVIASATWYAEGGLAAAARALAAGADGIFCCNDRLAEGVLAWCRQHGLRRPRIVGFDDAPVAEELELSTIAIPWTEMIDAAAQIIRARLSRRAATGSQRIFAPRPVLRRL
jgi:DNA-binding LacI/PurR family transcriptional regulator